MALILVNDDSMAPAFKSNDMVMLDKSQTDLRLGKIYALNVEGFICLKLVNALPGKIVLSSSNPEYAPIELPTNGDIPDGVKILGRVVWLGRSI